MGEMGDSSPIVCLLHRSPKSPEAVPGGEKRPLEKVYLTPRSKMIAVENDDEEDEEDEDEAAMEMTLQEDEAAMEMTLQEEGGVLADGPQVKPVRKEAGLIGNGTTSTP